MNDRAQNRFLVVAATEGTLAILSLVSLLVMPRRWSNPGGVDGAFIPWHALTISLLGVNLFRAYAGPHAHFLSAARLIALLGAAFCVVSLGVATTWYLSLPPGWTK